MSGLSDGQRERLAEALGRCPFVEDANDASMCRCGLPALGHDEVATRIVLDDHPAVAPVVAASAAEAATEYVASGQAWQAMQARVDQADARYAELVDQVRALADEWGAEDAMAWHVAGCQDYECKDCVVAACVVAACASDLRALLDGDA